MNGFLGYMYVSKKYNFFKQAQSWKLMCKRRNNLSFLCCRNQGFHKEKILKQIVESPHLTTMAISYHLQANYKMGKKQMTQLILLYPESNLCILPKQLP
jgi:hypothetical protein